MNFATATAQNTSAVKQSLVIDYHLRTLHSSLERFDRNGADFTASELTDLAQEISVKIVTALSSTFDRGLRSNLCDILDELQEILPPQAPSRDKLFFSLSVARSMIAESLID